MRRFSWFQLRCRGAGLGLRKRRDCKGGGHSVRDVRLKVSDWEGNAAGGLPVPISIT